MYKIVFYLHDPQPVAFEIMGERFDEFNSYELTFTKNGERHVQLGETEYLEDGTRYIKPAKEFHSEYWSDFQFEVDGDLCGKATIRVCWDKMDNITVSIVKY